MSKTSIYPVENQWQIQVFALPAEYWEEGKGEPTCYESDKLGPNPPVKTKIKRK